MAQKDILYCKKCKKQVEVLVDCPEDVYCCQSQMEKVTAHTSGQGEEKHLPVVKISGNTVTVSAGSVSHPMDAEHNIAWISLETEHSVCRKFLEKGEKPEAEFMIPDPSALLRASAYCNLHGLWTRELKK